MKLPILALRECFPVCGLPFLPRFRRMRATQGHVNPFQEDFPIQGKNGYYNLLSKACFYKAPEEPGSPMTWEIPAELITASSITISGVEYELQQGFFFITQEPVEYFKIGNHFFNVE